MKKKIKIIKKITKIVYLFQILAAMQRELAASGLSPEEILAKTLLLQKVTNPNLTKPNLTKPNLATAEVHQILQNFAFAEGNQTKSHQSKLRSFRR